ncbi:MAG: hypothetical protein V1740_03450 [Candidatus Woesearchaeota archaeon]
MKRNWKPFALLAGAFVTTYGFLSIFRPDAIADAKNRFWNSETGNEVSFLIDKYLPQQRYAQIFEGDEPLRIVSRFAANPGNDYRTVLKISENEAIRQLEGLLESNYEEAWAFLPEKQQFIEIGQWEQKFSTKMRSFNNRHDWDYDHLVELLIENDDIVIYHTQPKPNEKYVEEVKDRYREFGYSEELIERKAFEYIISLSLPNPMDMARMIRASLAIKDIHPEGQFRVKLCSPYGVTEYWLTDQGADFIKGPVADEHNIYVPGSDNPIALYSPYSYLMFTELNHRSADVNQATTSPAGYYAFWPEFHDPIDFLRETTAKMTNDFVKVRFRTYDEVLENKVARRN